MFLKIIKNLFLMLVAVVVILLGAFFYISTGFFVQTHVLPRAAAILGTEVVADDVSFWAPSGIEFKNLRVGPKADPLFRAATIRVHYQTSQLCRGRLVVDDVTVNDVLVDANPQKVQDLRKALAAAGIGGPRPVPAAAPAKSGAPLELPPIAIQNVNVQKVKLHFADPAQGLDVSIGDLNVTLPRLANDGSDFELSVRTQAQLKCGPRLEAQVGEIVIGVQGALTPAMLPSKVQVQVQVGKLAGRVGAVSLAGREVKTVVALKGDGNQYQLTQLQVTELAQGKQEVAFTSTGQVVLQPLGAALDLQLDLPPGTLLNLAGALAGGLDFGKTAIAYRGHVDLQDGGLALASRGDLDVRDFSVALPAKGVQPMAPLQAALKHDLALDFGKQVFTLKVLDGGVRGPTHQFATVSLDQPLVFSRKQALPGSKGVLTAKVEKLDLTAFNPLLGAVKGLKIAAGRLNDNFTLTVAEGGRRIAVHNEGGIDDLQLEKDGQALGKIRTRTPVELTVTDFKHLVCQPVPLEVAVALPGKGYEPVLTLRRDIDILGKRDDKGQLLVDIVKFAIHIDVLKSKDAVVLTVPAASVVLADLQKPDAVRLPADLAVNLPLAQFQPYVPAAVGLARLGGSVVAKLRFTAVGAAKQLLASGTAGAEQFDFALANGLALAQPISPRVELEAALVPGGEATLSKLNAKLPGKDKTLVDVTVSGHFDTAMKPASHNELLVRGNAPIPLADLQALLVLPPKAKAAPAAAPAAPAIPAAAAGPAPALPKLWVTAKVQMPEISYRLIVIKNLDLVADYRDAKLDVPTLTLLLNDGDVAVKANADLTDIRNPGYVAQVKAGKLAFAPFINSFLPAATLKLRGGIKSADVQLHGQGCDLAALQQNLTLGVAAKLDTLVLEKIEGLTGQLVETLLFNIFPLQWQDLEFFDGGCDLAIDAARYKDHDIHVNELRLLSKEFQLNTVGKVQFGGKWTPDLDVQNGWRQGMAAKLAAKHIKMAAQPDASGLLAGPAIPLRGDLSSLENHANLLAELLVRAGLLSEADRQKAAAAGKILGSLKKDGNLLDNLKGALGGDSSKSTGEAVKEKAGELVGGLLDKAAKKDQAETPKDDAKKAAKDAAKDVLKGLLK